MATRAFAFRGKNIRTVPDGGKVWFVAADVCDALELVNPSMVVSTQVSDADRQLVRVDTLGGPQRLLAVNDIGLYEIILSARSALAKEFEAWVSGVMFKQLGIPTPDEGNGGEKVEKE